MTEPLLILPPRSRSFRPRDHSRFTSPIQARTSSGSMSSSTPQQQLIAYIHHERQEQGSMLCASTRSTPSSRPVLRRFAVAQLPPSWINSKRPNWGSAKPTLQHAIVPPSHGRTRASSACPSSKGHFKYGALISNWRSAAMRTRHDAPERERPHSCSTSTATGSPFARSDIEQVLVQSQLISGRTAVDRQQLSRHAPAHRRVEGYSGFVVQASEGSAGQGLRESDADQIADHLPAPGAASSDSRSSTTNPVFDRESTQERQASPCPQASDFGASTRGFGSATRRKTPNFKPHSASAWRKPLPPVRTHHTDLASSSAQLGATKAVQGGDTFMGETDADIDAIAPSRRRHRADYSDPVNDDLRRAMEASMTSSTPSRASSSTAADTSSSRPVGRRKRRAQERQSGLSREDAIELDDSRDDSDDNELRPSSLSHRSPFLAQRCRRPTRTKLGRGRDRRRRHPSDDELVDPFSVPGAPVASALIGPRTGSTLRR